MMQSPFQPEAAELIAGRFRALSDPTRLRILDQLRRHDEVSVGELTETLGTSQQNASKHLAALRAEGFVSRRKRGTSSLYRISDPAVLELCDRLCGRWSLSSPSSARCSPAEFSRRGDAGSPHPGARG
jgi:ArsR family transcriptional regulator